MPALILHKYVGITPEVDMDCEDKRTGDRSVFAAQFTVFLGVAYCAIAYTSLHTGAADAQPWEVFAQLAGFGSEVSADLVRNQIVVLDIRLPRLVLGSLIGAALAVSGAMLQSLFRNPLADTGIIGIAAGAGLGAISIIVLGGTALSYISSLLGIFALPVTSFAGALITILILYSISTRNGQTSVITMLLAGIAIQAFGFALTGLLMYVADDQQLRDLTFWSLGSLAGATWTKVFSAGPIIVIGLLITPFLAKGLNAFSLGENTAYHLGISVQRLKSVAIIVVAAISGSAVAVSGGIGFIGIVVPHLLRLIIGPDNRYLMPASAIFGASLLVLSDMIARTIVAPAELPIGILTALIGAPFFIWLLLHRREIINQ